MTLADEQFSYNGLTFGRGCDVMVNKAEGFEGFDTRVSDVDQPRNHGALRGFDYVAARLPTFELSIIETADIDGSTYEALYASVRTAFTPSVSQDLPLVFKRPGQPERQIYCRPIQLQRVEAYKNYNRFGFPPIVMRGADPRIYSTAVYQQNVPIYAASAGGTEFGIDFPVDFTGGLQGETIVRNAGLSLAYPLIRIYGPLTGTCTAVTLTNSTTGQVFQVNTTITTGQILTADMRAAVTGASTSVIDLSGASRYGSWALPRAPFALTPGFNSIRFQVTGTSTDVVCGLTWSDTWME